MSKSQIFIDCFNKIDQSLRFQYDFRRNMSFGEVIKKSSLLNAVVKKYQDVLIDYGRLRNAIVHQSSGEFVIAEPNDKAVAQIVKICSLITSPPRVMDTIAMKNIITIDHDKSIKDAIKLIDRSGFSNIPIFKEGGIIGVANSKKIFERLAKEVSEGNDIEKFINEHLITEIEYGQGFDNYYSICDEGLTIDRALDMFYKNRKLILILITKSGNYLEKPIGLITDKDILDINHILDNFV